MTDFMIQLDNNAHSVFLLYYHLILVVKYRKHVINDTISERTKEIFSYIAPKYNITLCEWNHDVDYINILFKANPNSEISKFINAYKSASSRLIKGDFLQVQKILWKDKFWSQSFCLISSGGISVDIIKRYIESHNKKYWT